jgi:hypothetical protein
METVCPECAECAWCGRRTQTRTPGGQPLPLRIRRNSIGEGFCSPRCQHASSRAIRGLELEAQRCVCGNTGRLVREVPALSPSIARVLHDESPRHAWSAHRLLGAGPRKTTEPMEAGKLMHHLVLEDGSRAVEIDADSYQTKAARELRDAARAAGHFPLLRSKAVSTHRAASRIRARMREYGYDLARAGLTEHRMEWQDELDSGMVIDCSGVID